LKLQTERLENHTARLIVELTLDDLEKAKKQAATKLSSRYKIPGFRKGKAPYNIVLKYLGEGAVLEEAIEMLGSDVYPKALQQSGLRPYASGTIDDFQLEPVPTYTFTLPLQAEVTLGDYRSVRKPYEPPTVTDEVLERTMQALRQQEAKTEDKDGPAAVGDRITVDLHSEFADGEEHPEHDGEEEHEHDHEVPFRGDEFLHRHDAVLNLNYDNEPVLPGFIDQIVGKQAGDTVEFELMIPTDSEDYASIAGRKVHFSVAIKKVQTVALPDLDDALAQKLTANEETPLNYEQLVARVRENLQREAEAEYESQYSNDVLEQIVTGATVAFPPAMVDERIREMVEEFKDRLKAQNISFDVYRSITGITEDKLHEQYRPEAEKSLRRSLTLGEVLFKEQMMVSNDDVSTEVNRLVREYGDSARGFFTSREQRENIASRLLFNRLMERLTMIGKGEAPEGAGETPTVTTAEND
jgi:trigger factor